MNANGLPKLYPTLTAEQRFKLILAASARGDEAERTRIGNAGPLMTLSAPDHYPFANAFAELGRLILIELVEDAAFYRDTLDMVNESDQDEADPPEASEGDAEGKPPGRGRRGRAQDHLSPAWVRSLEISYAAAYVLRTKADGWKLFCERLNVPPFLLWEGLPGFDRLQRALDLAEKGAFRPDGFLAWLNRTRPAGDPLLTEMPLTVERLASAAEETYRECAGWWGG